MGCFVQHMRGSARLRRSVQNLDAQLSSIDHQLQQKQTQQLRHSLTLALSGDPPSEVVTLVSPRKAAQQLRPATAAAASSQSPSDFALNIQQMKLQTEMEELKRNRHELHQVGWVVDWLVAREGVFVHLINHRIAIVSAEAK